ncbi:MAG: hypothetical protein L3J07_00970 [Candidatus Magasanikbacteria bacterium]|nr:hypothetical protein [Candidatus Magasanikbacteria bacterium]
MQSNTSKIVLAVIITAIVVGGGVYYWQSYQTAEPDSATQSLSIRSGMETYSSEKYSFNYPNSYTVTLVTQSFPALTVEKAGNKRVEIFQMKDFGDRPWGFEGTETQEDIDGYVPKKTLTVGSGDNQYEVWLYYSENDSQTKKEVKAIFDSIVVK